MPFGGSELQRNQGLDRAHEPNALPHPHVQRLFMVCVVEELGLIGVRECDRVLVEARGV